MFTGIIREIGALVSADAIPSGRRLSIESKIFDSGVLIGDSICVSGVCLTVVDLRPSVAAFDVIPETLRKTTLGSLSEGSRCNLEGSLRFGDSVDGHLVQGHVDATARLLSRAPEAVESERFEFALPSEIQRLVAVKGSICIDGVSLTVGEAGRESFSVYLIPHTLSATTLGALRQGDAVNLEADCLARYAARILAPDL